MISDDISVRDVIHANIKIEHNHNLSGSHQGMKKEPMKTVPAADEGEREEVNALTFVSPLAYKLILNLQEIRVTRDMIQNLDPNLRVTKGLFMIKYVPKTDKDYRKGRPWKIGQDLIRMGIRVSGPKHWHLLCDKIPELKWIERNSTLTDKAFSLAAQHPGMTFWFTVDWFRYVAKLSAQPGIKFGSERNNIEAKPFAAYKCSLKEYREHYKDKTATLRVLSDVLKEVQEVESSETVQKEMMEATGETAITREQYIPGHGGVHQPKDPVTGRFLKKSDLDKETE